MSWAKLVVKQPIGSLQSSVSLKYRSIYILKQYTFMKRFDWPSLKTVQNPRAWFSLFMYEALQGPAVRLLHAIG